MGVNNFNERTAVLLGGMPGSGKSRLGRAITEELHAAIATEHISIGDRVRAIGRDAVNSAYRQHVIDHLNNPHAELPIDDEIIEGIAREALQEFELRDIVLLDGFPRYKTQVEPMFELASDEQRSVSGLIVTNVAPAIAKERLIRRGRKSSERALDAELADWRIQHYRQTFRPVVSALGRKGIYIATINTAGDKNATTERGITVVSDMLEQASNAS